MSPASSPSLNGMPLAIELAAAALGDRPFSGVLSGLDRPLLAADPRTADRPASPPDPSRRAGVEPRPAPNRRAAPVRSARRIRRRRDHRGDRRGVRRPARSRAATSPDASATWLAPRCSSRTPSCRNAGPCSSRSAQLAAIELEAAGEDDELAARHRTWFADRVERVEPEIGRSGQPQVMADLAADQDNVRRAIDTGSLRGTTPSRASSLHRDGAVLDLARRLDGGMRAAPRSAGPARRATGDCGDGPSLPWGTSCCCAGDLAEAEVRLAEATPARRPIGRRRRPGARAGRCGATWSSAGPTWPRRRPCGRRRWRRASAPATNGLRPGSSAASPSPPAAAAARTVPETCSTGPSTWLDERETINSSGCCSARPPRCTSGSGTTRRRRTPTETPSPWPRRSATCRLVRCCWPSWAGWPCCAATWSPPNACRSRRPSSRRISGTAGCWPTLFG